MRCKRFLALLLTASIILPMTGCWDYQEFEDIALVSAIGYDYDEASKEITVTIQHYIPAAGGAANTKGGDMTIPLAGGTVIAKGKTIPEAVNKIQSARRKNLFFGYINVILLGEAAAKNIMKDVILVTDRTPNIRSTAYIAVTEGRAEDVLCVRDPNIPVSIGRSIYDLIEQSLESGYSYPVTFQDFVEELEISGVEAVAPRVTAVVTKHMENEGDFENLGDMPERVVNLNEGYHFVDGIAIFKNDKLAGWLDKKDAGGLAWLTGQDVRNYETVMTDSEDDDQNYVIVNIQGAKCKIKVKMEGDKPVFTVSAKVEAALLKYSEKLSSEEQTPDVVEFIQGKLAETVRKQIESAVIKIQKEQRSDAAGFGFVLYRKYPKLWHEKFEKDWEELFPSVLIHVEVEAKIQNTGTVVRKLFIK